MTITRELPRLLSKVERPGDFYGAGETPLPVVRMEVDGVGLLGLPLPVVQVEALAAVAAPAPYGRGTETLVDPSVRRCGQIEARSVHADDPRWRTTLGRIVAEATKALGVEGKVDA